MQLLIEGTAIVASILLAFWIDAWWEGRQSRQAEGLYLNAVLADIEDVIHEVDRTIAGNEMLNLRANERISGYRNGISPSDEEVSIVIEEVSVSYRLRANLDTYSDLLSSGGVLTLRDAEVRRSLSGLRTVMDFEQEVFGWVVESGHRVVPDIVERLAAGELQIVARLEEQVLHSRENHNQRKSEVKTAALAAKTAIQNALNNMN